MYRYPGFQNTNASRRKHYSSLLLAFGQGRPTSWEDNSGKAQYDHIAGSFYELQEDYSRNKKHCPHIWQLQGHFPQVHNIKKSRHLQKSHREYQHNDFVSSKMLLLFSFGKTLQIPGARETLLPLKSLLMKKPSALKTQLWGWPHSLSSIQPGDLANKNLTKLYKLF